MWRFILILSLFIPFLIQGQSYTPFVKENAVWKVIQHVWQGHGSGVDFYSYTLYMDGDTIIDGKSYKFLFRTDFDSLNLKGEKYLANLIREDSTKRVYFRERLTDTSFCKDEYLLYDFGAEIGDTLDIDTVLSTKCNYSSTPYLHIVDTIYEVVIDGKILRRFEFKDRPEKYWIESIGSIEWGFFGPKWGEPFEGGEYLGCYYDQDIFWAEDYDKGCQYAGIEDMKSVKWQLKYFPNPVKGKLFLSEAYPIESYKVYDVSGTLRLNGQFQNFNNEIDLSTLNSGIYFLKVFGPYNWSWEFRIIKE